MRGGRELAAQVCPFVINVNDLDRRARAGAPVALSAEVPELIELLREVRELLGCLALVPVAVVVARLWMGIAGLITGAQWALDVDGSVWLGIGRWLVVAVGLGGVGYGLFASARWTAGLAQTWKGHGMPKWPGWRKR